MLIRFWSVKTLSETLFCKVAVEITFIATWVTFNKSFFGLYRKWPLQAYLRGEETTYASDRNGSSSSSSSSTSSRCVEVEVDVEVELDANEVEVVVGVGVGVVVVVGVVLVAVVVVAVGVVVPRLV